MEIKLSYFEGCPNTQPAHRLLYKVLGEQGIDAVVKEINVTTEEEAQFYQFLGSPSIRVNGVDLGSRQAAPTDYGLRCHLYRNHGAVQGYPSREMIQATIQSARKSQEVANTSCSTPLRETGQLPAEKEVAV